MKRYGSVIKVKPEALTEYKRYHAAVWPDVLDMIKKCNIRNYSIYLKDDFLFGYFRIPRHRLQSRHGKNGRRQPDTGVVGRDDANAATARDAQRRRMVGRDGRGLSYGLAPP